MSKARAIAVAIRQFVHIAASLMGHPADGGAKPYLKD